MAIDEERARELRSSIKTRSSEDAGRGPIYFSRICFKINFADLNNLEIILVLRIISIFSFTQNIGRLVRHVYFGHSPIRSISPGDLPGFLQPSERPQKAALWCPSSTRSLAEGELKESRKREKILFQKVIYS